MATATDLNVRIGVQDTGIDRVISGIAAKARDANAAMTRAANDTNAAMAGAETQTVRMDRALYRLSASYRNQEERIDAVAKAQRQLNEARAIAERAVDSGIRTQEQANRVVAMYEARLRNMQAMQSGAAAGAQAMAGAHKLSAYQVQNLSFQVNDLVAGILQGQNAFRIMAQQGPQIVQGFGGVGATFRAAGAAIGAVGPVALTAAAAVTAMAGTFAVGAARAETLERQLRQLRVVAAAANPDASLSPARLQQQIISFARAPGVNRETAQDAAVTLARQPGLNAELIERALPLTRDLAAAMGTDIPTAAKAMAAAMTGGLQAVDGLDRQLNFLSRTQREQIRSLEDQGRTAAAAGIVLDALGGKIRGLADQGVTPAEEATNNLGNAWDNLLDTLAKTGPVTAARDAMIAFLKDIAAAADPARRSIDEQAAAVQRYEAALQRLRDKSAERNYVPGGREFQIDRATQDVITTGLERAGLAPDPSINDAEAIMKAMDAVGSAAQGAGEKLGVAKVDFAEMEKAVGKLAEALDPATVATKKLENQQAMLLTLMANGKGDVEALTKLFALLGREIEKVDNAENRAARRTADIGIAGLWGVARARREAEEAERQAAGSNAASIAAAGNQGAQRYLAGIGANVGEQIQQLEAQGAALLNVAEAYLKNNKAAREAEIQMQAEIATREIGTAAAVRLAAALRYEADARRAIQGAQLIRATTDEVEAQTKLVAALEKGSDAYREAEVQAKVTAAVQAGLFDRLAQGAEWYADQLRALQKLQDDRDAIGANRRYDPAEAAKQQIEELQRLERTGKLTARAQQEAWRDAYITMGRNGSSWVDGARAGLLEYQRQAERSGAAVADALTRGLEQVEDVLTRLALGMETNIKQAIQGIGFEILRLGIRQNITGPLAGLGAQLLGGGIPGNAGGAANGAAGGGAGSSPLSFAGLGNIGGFLGQGIFGPSAASYNGVIPGQSGAATARMFGDPTGGATWGQGLTSAAMAAGGAYQLATGGGSTGSIIAGAGTIIGAGVDMFVPGLGTAIAIGSQILGGILADKPVSPQATTDIVIENGRAVVGGNTNRGSGNTTGTNRAGQSVADELNRTLWNVGLRFGSGAQGGYLLNSTGQQTGEQWIFGSGSYANGSAVETASGLSGSSAMAGLLGNIIQRAAANGQLVETGRIAVSQTMLAVLGEPGEFADDELKRRIDTAKAYDDILLGQGSGTDVTRAIRSLKEEFNALAFEAERLGLAVAPLDAELTARIEKMGADFMQGLSDRILQNDDPVAYQRALNLRAYNEGLAQADALWKGGALSLTKYNEALADLEKLLDISNDNAFSTALGGPIGSLENLIRRTTFGDLGLATPTQTLAGLQASYQSVQAQLAADPDNAKLLQNLATAGEALAAFANQYYGGGIPAQQISQMIASDAAVAIANAEIAAGVSPAQQNAALIGEMQTFIATFKAIAESQNNHISQLVDTLNIKLAA